MLPRTSTPFVASAFLAFFGLIMLSDSLSTIPPIANVASGTFAGDQFYRFDNSNYSPDVGRSSSIRYWKGGGRALSQSDLMKIESYSQMKEADACHDFIYISRAWEKRIIRCYKNQPDGSATPVDYHLAPTEVRTGETTRLKGLQIVREITSSSPMKTIPKAEYDLIRVNLGLAQKRKHDTPRGDTVSQEAERVMFRLYFSIVLIAALPAWFAWNLRRYII